MVIVLMPYYNYSEKNILINTGGHIIMAKTSAKNIIIDSRSSVKITMTALFAALCCIATMVIQIPTPTDGFINLGDCIVLISGYLLGPVYGGLAAGIGSMLADILSGYAYYAPATFIIKAVMAVCAFYLYKILSGSTSSVMTRIASVISALICEIIMILGYFAFSAFILGAGLGAINGIPGNVVQGAAAIIISTILHELIKAIKL